MLKVPGGREGGESRASEWWASEGEGEGTGG